MIIKELRQTKKRETSYYENQNSFQLDSIFVVVVHFNIRILNIKQDSNDSNL